ncbi:hypothetical protein [Sulfurimonas sp. C5]|uniref:hypothetical protein n=1 Tax=Sulfurimonas sp. C5 TaxID=3036947 RepID=UPI0024540D6B|nr:hypothetical protein [Sulfurimonas sp. C5]MDH4944502.1 hypothetical protein [Sulfurimonas sp. C5]
MKMREFSIQTKKLEYLGYAQEELSLNVIEDHLYYELDVPQEYIKNLELTENALYIKLIDKVRYFNEDWYVNIQRIA